MTEQLAASNTGYRPMRPSTDVCRWTALDTGMGILRMWMPKYPRLHIYVNDVSAQKLNDITRIYHSRILKSNKI